MKFARAALVVAVMLALSGVAAVADDAPTFRIGAAHSGAQPNDPLRPPLSRRWSIDLGGPVYVPLIIGGTAFVVAGNMPGPVYPNYGSRLYAINLSDGHVIWGPVNADPWGGYYFSGLTYDGGRLFVAMGSGSVDAVDPNTGAFLWPQPVPVYGIGINAQPTAVNGVVYVTSVGNQYAPPGPIDPSDASVTALRESDGRVLWIGGIDSGDWSAPVVSSSGVYVTNACEDTWDFDPASGKQLWHYVTGCYGGGGTTPALWQGRLYVRDTANAPGTVLDAGSGTFLGHFPSRMLPAFNASTAFLIPQTTNYPGLIAWNTTTMTPQWTLPPPPGDWFVDAPVFANGDVYSATRNGELICASAANGSELWSANLGQELTGMSNENNPDESSGISIGNGWLLIPVNSELIAYTSGSVGGPRHESPPGPAVPFRPRPATAAAATTSASRALSSAAPRMIAPGVAAPASSWAVDRIGIDVGLVVLELTLS